MNNVFDKPLSQIEAEAKAERERTSQESYLNWVKQLEEKREKGQNAFNALGKKYKERLDINLNDNEIELKRKHEQELRELRNEDKYRESIRQVVKAISESDSVFGTTVIEDVKEDTETEQPLTSLEQAYKDLLNSFTKSNK